MGVVKKRWPSANANVTCSRHGRIVNRQREKHIVALMSIFLIRRVVNNSMGQLQPIVHKRIIDK